MNITLYGNNNKILVKFEVEVDDICSCCSMQSDRFYTGCHKVGSLAKVLKPLSTIRIYLISKTKMLNTSFGLRQHYVPYCALSEDYISVVCVL